MPIVYSGLAFMLGLTTMIVQLVLLREFMSLFMGNELVIGIILALWMLITASGAMAGRYVSHRNKNASFALPMLVMMGMLPIMAMLTSIWLKNILFAPGVMISLQGILLICASGLLLFCLVSGMMFTLLASSLSDSQRQNSISRIYAVEALGALTGGFLFNFIFIHTLNSLQVLSIILITNLLSAVWAAYLMQKRIWALTITLLSLIASLALLRYDLNLLAAEMNFSGQEILLNKDTPYGKLVLTDNSGQLVLYKDGLPALIADDIANKEEKVHYAMSLHHKPENVLMLSGGLDGAIAEVLKYQDIKLTYVEPDRWKYDAAIKYFGHHAMDETQHLHMNPVRFLLQANTSAYDIILLNTPPPNTIGNNRFYSREFFMKAKRTLSADGILSLQLPGSGNYLNENIRRLYSSVYKTLDADFEHIRIIPGKQTYFLASDHAIEGNITHLIDKKGIKNEYVNQWYLDDGSLYERAGIIREALDPEARLNTDFHPMAAYLSIKLWLKMFHIPVWIILAVPLLFMAIILLRQKAYNIGLFASGFTASAAEFLLLIAFQLSYGFLYQMAGLIIMIFMAGLALGSGYTFRFIAPKRGTFIQIQILSGIFIGLMPLALLGLQHIQFIQWLPGVVIGMLTFISAAFMGTQFRLATMLTKGKSEHIAATAYGADLAGSAFGIFLVAIFVFPLLGMINTGLILAGVNFLLAIIVKWRVN